MVETYYSQNDVSATNETTVNQNDESEAYIDEYEEVKDSDINQINLSEAIYLRDNRFLDKTPGNFGRSDGVILNLILLN